MRMRAIERSRTSSRTSMYIRNGRIRMNGPTIPRGSTKISQRNSRNTSSTGRRTLIKASLEPKRVRRRIPRVMTSGSAASRPLRHPPKCRHRQRRWVHHHPIKISQIQRKRPPTSSHSTNLHRKIVVSSQQPERETSWTCLVVVVVAQAKLQAM